MVERTIKIKATGNSSPSIPLGVQGENLARAIVFDVSELVSAFGDGTALILNKRRGDAAPYPCTEVTHDGETVTWTLTSVDTAVRGAGEAQVHWYVDGALAKSITCRTVTLDAATASVIMDAPDAYETWLEKLTSLGAETLGNATSASGYADSASASASASAASATAAAESAENAAESATAAAESAAGAATSEANAEKYAELASEEAASKGFFYVEGRGDGHLWYVKTDNVENITLKDNGEGRLVAQYG